jgi:hypothetical protein
MTSTFGIALGAGLASALLFTVVTAGSALAVVLYFAAPLPILIAGLGWSQRAGLLAALVASAAVAIALTGRAGLVFAIGVGIPAWWFAYLLLLARETEDGVEWYPIGRVLAAVALLSAAVTVIGMFTIASDYASLVSVFESAVNGFRERNPQLFAQLGARDLPNADLARLMAVVAPAISAAVGVLSSSILLWGAARIVLASGRLPRPWPDLPSIDLPRTVLLLYSASILASFGPDGMFALAARTTAAALTVAYAFQGLAAIHSVSRGFSARGLLLGSLYTVLVVMPGWPILALAVLGVAESFLRFRGRAPSAPPPPVTPSD